MASYPTLAATLTALNATKNDPTADEDASKLDDALRQTRNWMYDFLSLSFDATTSKLLPAAVDVTSLSGLIRGSSANAGTQREILQGSVSDVDLRTDSVTSAKIKDLAVTTAKLVDASVTLAKIGPYAVDATKIANGAITAVAIADNVISGTKLLDNSVTSVKLADGAISPTKLAGGFAGDKLGDAAAGFVLVGGNTVNSVPNKLAPKQLHGVITIDADGLTAYDDIGASSLPYMVIVERAAKGVNAPGATGVNVRGSASVCPWALQDGTQTQASPFVLIDGSGVISIGTPGRYLIRAHAPAIEVGLHKVVLAVKPDADVATVYYFEGSSEFSGGAGGYAQTRSHVQRVIDLTNCTASKYCLLTVYHILQGAANAAIACGYASNLTPSLGGSPMPLHEIYAQIEIVKLA